MQLGGVRSTSQVAKSFIGTGFKLVPIPALPPPDMTNNPEVPKTPLELTDGIPTDAGVTVPEFMLRPPIPPIILEEVAAELPPDAMVAPGFTEWPLVKGV